jgi:hypothetical protein
MAHYSVFYFLGRAAKRCAEEKTALEYPEDVFFLLDSVGDNLKHFRRAMNDLATDCGRTVFKSPREDAPPFKEISAYRDIFLHNPVIGRGVGVEKTYIPKWSADKSASPLERTARPADPGCRLFTGKFMADGSGRGDARAISAQDGQGHRTYGLSPGARSAVASRMGAALGNVFEFGKQHDLCDATRQRRLLGETQRAQRIELGIGGWVVRDTQPMEEPHYFFPYSCKSVTALRRSTPCRSVTVE